MSIGATVFEDIYSAMTDAQAEVRQGKRSTPVRALCGGMGTMRMDSDQGQFLAADVIVRLLLSEATDLNLDESERIELDAHGTGWREFRIAGRFDQAGVVRLTLESLDE